MQSRHTVIVEENHSVAKATLSCVYLVSQSIPFDLFGGRRRYNLGWEDCANPESLHGVRWTFCRIFRSMRTLCKAISTGKPRSTQRHADA